MSEPVNVAEYFELAAAKVDPAVWCYFEGGAGDEVTLRANVGAYARWRFRPRVLADVGEVSTRTTV
ncbi:MAG: alpha-hydroxy-acid oxidizing protein, partial [Actinobacteria bacterium]